ncbi:MAG: TonB-dependent receptor [Pedosphaera sp.]|nr:TonB-dependent receptor [Pedosphaera sp.]
MYIKLNARVSYSSYSIGKKVKGLYLLLLAAAFFNFTKLAHAEPTSVTNQAGIILTIERTVEVARSGSLQWTPATTNLSLRFGDSLRTGPGSRATVRLSDLSILRVNEKTVLEIRSQTEAKGSLLDLKSGSSYFFNRSKPASLQFHTPLISGAIRGTEFNLAAEEDGRTVVTLLEGEVALNNAKGDLVLQSGEQGIVDPGQAPRKTAVLQAINIIQWSLYYPAVLDLDEIGLSEQEKSTFAESLSAYRSGDLLAALTKYPENHEPVSDAEKLEQAALLLAVGQVDHTESRLKTLQTPSRLAQALRKVIAAVKHQEVSASQTPETASEWLAESYYQQSRSKLNEALTAAQEAVKKSPNFGFAWVRVAELQFGLGQTSEAKSALEHGLQLSPRNAQALALKGFLLTAENKITEATSYFNQAIAVDGALANAWLGRGLCEMRQGHRDAGRQDLQVAAALEPNRSDLRSYLGKAWDETNDRKHADKELKLAKQLDPADPTPWLYSALLAHEYNRDNEAISDLEKSKQLNNNRSIYRSRFLLDQDQAVRSANLAKMYQDVGMFDVSVREAARAVDYDYANYSAHLFLANSYDALRDPKQVNLRYETPWFSQLLVADLLAPVGSVPLSQNVSQQEYTRLFNGDHFGMYSSTEYLSRGDWIQNASVYGNSGNTGYAFDAYYRSENGWRPNNDLEDFNLSAKLKQQLTPQDSILFEVDRSVFSSGDVLQYYDQKTASPSLRIKEIQEPNLYAGYHHEWSPGVHTLFLAGRLQDNFTATDTNANVFIVHKKPNGEVTGVSQRPALFNYESDLVTYSAELQQIFQSSSHTLVLGGRYQSGDIDTRSFVRASKPVAQVISPDLARLSGYGYYLYQVADPLQLTAGLSYDHLEYPQNNEIPPLSSIETHKDQVSPKAGFRWTPLEDTTFRGAWSRSLGGVFYDTSVRLEPTQIAGFNQAFRSVIPESIAGLVPGSEFESFGLAFDQKFPTRTYLTIIGEILNSHGTRTVGALDAFGPLLIDVPSGMRQTLDYQEKSFSLILNQLVGDEFAIGAKYRVSVASLEDRVPSVPAVFNSNFSLSANRDVSATLHQLNLYALYNHRCGFFSQVESIWSGQSNQGYAVDLPGDDFWQFNTFCGYRFPRRLAEIRLGVLNIADRNYNLNPLNLYSDLPRTRTFVASFKFNF